MVLQASVQAFDIRPPELPITPNIIIKLALFSISFTSTINIFIFWYRWQFTQVIIGNKKGRALPSCLFIHLLQYIEFDRAYPPFHTLGMVLHEQVDSVAADGSAGITGGAVSITLNI